MPAIVAGVTGTGAQQYPFTYVKGSLVASPAGPPMGGTVRINDSGVLCCNITEQIQIRKNATRSQMSIFRNASRFAPLQLLSNSASKYLHAFNSSGTILASDSTASYVHQDLYGFVGINQMVSGPGIAEWRGISAFPKQNDTGSSGFGQIAGEHFSSDGSPTNGFFILTPVPK